MFRTTQPLDQRIFTTQGDKSECIEEGRTLEVALPEPDAQGAVPRRDRRPKSALKERIQAGTAHFEFDALLQGVSMRDAATCSTNVRDSAELIWVPGGEFLMGSYEGELRERPVHRVLLDGFWIYKTPVSVAQYRKFYAEIGRPLRTAPAWGWDDEHPIVNVTWEYASAYAKWVGASLPTEAEWEYAARGADGRQYPWGNAWDPERCCNSVGNRLRGVAPIGRFPRGASPHGVLDMAGNVWEWTADWYEQGYYATSPEANPTGPVIGTHRVLRGGSWGNDMPHDYRVTTRMACEPGARGGSIGFRCVVRADALAPPDGKSPRP